MEEQLCLFCKRFTMVAEEPDWSDVTPGSNFEMYCSKNHWDFDTRKASEDDFRKTLLTAEDCKDYTFFKTWPKKEVTGK